MKAHRQSPKYRYDQRRSRMSGSVLDWVVICVITTCSVLTGALIALLTIDKVLAIM